LSRPDFGGSSLIQVTLFAHNVVFPLYKHLFFRFLSACIVPINQILFFKSDKSWYTRVEVIRTPGWRRLVHPGVPVIYTRV